MRIAFCSIDVLNHAIAEFDPDAVVSIWGPRYPMRTSEAGSICT